MTQFFVFGCKEHIEELLQACKSANGVHVGDSGALRPDDPEFAEGCPCAPPGEECTTDSFAFLEV